MKKPRIVLAAILLLCGTPALAQTTLPASSADWIVEGDQPTGTFGLHVAAAGDVDGDGYDDVLIGDASHDGALLLDSGRISFYRGSAGGLSPAPAWTLEGSVSGVRLSRAFPAGDVNGDGHDDVVVDAAAGLSLYLGSTAGPMASTWAHPDFLNGRGDVNADGFTDIAVYSSHSILIFHGSAAGLDPAPSAILPLPPAEQPVFLDGDVVEDLDGDGHDDLAFTWRYCARNCDYLISELRVHLGSDEGIESQPKRTLVFKVKFENLSPFVASAGDVDGDGFGDLALTLRPDLAAGGGPDEVYWLRGNRAGLSTRSTLVVSTVAGSLEPGSVTGAGDLDGDGFADILVPDTDLNVPPYRSLLIYTGGPEGFSGAPTLTVEPEQARFEPTIPASRAGDVNGDGLGDLIMGSPEFTSGGQPVGRVYVFHGRPAF